jgi:NADH-quinone oxidoreductase subunit F
MLPADLALRCTLDHESIAEAGSMLGSGAVIAINERTCLVRVTERLAAFYAHESCGKCVPCREGTAWLYQSSTASKTARDGSKTWTSF